MRRKRDDAIRAGDLKDRITIQQPSRTIVDGVDTHTWTNVATSVPADVQSAPGLEREVDGQTQAQSKRVVTMRPLHRTSAGVDATMRIVFGSRYLQIDAVDNVNEENKKLVLNCTETSGDAAQQGGA